MPGENEPSEYLHLQFTAGWIGVTFDKIVDDLAEHLTGQILGLPNLAQHGANLHEGPALRGER